MNKKLLGLLLIGLGVVSWSFAQNPSELDPFGAYDFPFFQGRGSSGPSNTLSSKDSLVCAWPMVPLRANPGQGGQYLQTVYFGEQVRRMGDQIQRNEGRNYVFVQTASGRSGWVHDYQFVPEGGLVTLLEDKAVYEGHATASATSRMFRAGELFILSDFVKGDWVELVGPKKTKVGWVKGIDRISFDPVDIKFAKLYQDALVKRTHTLRFRALEEIRRLPDFQLTKLEPIINLAAMEIGGATADVGGGDVYYDDGMIGDIGGTPNPTRDGSVVVLPEENTPRINVEKVVDMQTGMYYNRVTETGQIAEVLGPKRPKNDFWAYHKSAPIGSQVLLHLPEGGFVALEVVARLKQTNPASVGLGKKLLESVYGTRHAKWATFSYPQ